MRVVDTNRDGTVQLSELEQFLSSAQQNVSASDSSGGFEDTTASTNQDALDIMCMCLQPNPSERPTAFDLSRLPFFSLHKHSKSISQKAALMAAQRTATTYMSTVSLLSL